MANVWAALVPSFGFLSLLLVRDQVFTGLVWLGTLGYIKPSPPSVDVMFLAVVGSGVSYPTSFVQDGASEQRRRAKAW